jgi:Fic family protein
MTAQDPTCPDAPYRPAPLPPAGLRLEGPLLGLLSTADVALGRLDGSVSTLPRPDLFVQMYVRKEAVLSSRIEGTQSSLDDLLSAEARVEDPSRPVDVEEVANYVAALRQGLARLAELPVSVRLLREIHGRLMQGARGGERAAGEFRRIQNWIGSEGCSIEEATFVPPAPLDLPELMGELEAFVHDRSSGLPDLVAIGLAHAQLETIHPFLDGNGRLGRLLITLLLCERGVLRQPVLYLSHHFSTRRAEYYDRLQRIRTHGEWREWLEFFLRGVGAVAEDAARTAARVLELREGHRDLIIDRLGQRAASGIRLLELLYGHPLINARFARERLGLSRPTTNVLVSSFEELGILREVTGKARNRRFRYEEYVRLFGEG